MDRKSITAHHMACQITRPNTTWYFPVGFVKDQVYRSRVRDLKDMQERIYAGVNNCKKEFMLVSTMSHFVLEHAIKLLEEKEGIQLNGINKLLVYADDVVLLGDNEEILRAVAACLANRTVDSLLASVYCVLLFCLHSAVT